VNQEAEERGEMTETQKATNISLVAQVTKIIAGAIRRLRITDSKGSRQQLAELLASGEELVDHLQQIRQAVEFSLKFKEGDRVIINPHSSIAANPMNYYHGLRKRIRNGPIYTVEKVEVPDDVITTYFGSSYNIVFIKGCKIPFIDALFEHV
jgi:hypothetical protein